MGGGCASSVRHKIRGSSFSLRPNATLSALFVRLECHGAVDEPRRTLGALARFVIKSDGAASARANQARVILTA